MFRSLAAALALALVAAPVSAAGTHLYRFMGVLAGNGHQVGFVDVGSVTHSGAMTGYQELWVFPDITPVDGMQVSYLVRTYESDCAKNSSRMVRVQVFDDTGAQLRDIPSPNAEMHVEQQGNAGWEIINLVCGRAGAAEPGTEFKSFDEARAYARGPAKQMIPN